MIQAIICGTSISCVKLTNLGDTGNAPIIATSRINMAERKKQTNFCFCRVGQYKEGEQVGNAEEFAHRIFTTVYMGTVNSGSATKDRAKKLAKQIGADHLDVKIDIVIEAMAKLFEVITGKSPRFRVSACCAIQLKAEVLPAF